MDGAGTVRVADSAAALTAELAAAEDDLEMGCDADAALAVAARVEAAAEALGDVELTLRARLLKADMSERKGYPAAVAATLWDVNRWAADHDHRPLLSRSFLLLARTYYNLGDMAMCLDHSVSAVETLDPAAAPYTRAYHVMKLADALEWNGSMDAARERYRQAELLAAASGPLKLQLMVLNNLAYSEYTSGDPLHSWAAIERMLAAAGSQPELIDSAKLDTIARTQIALRRYADAEETIRASLRTYHARGFEVTSSLAEQLLTLAVVQRHLGATGEAQATLDQVRALCSKHGHAGIEVRALQEQAELHAATGDFRAAYETLQAYLVAAEELRSQQREAQARTRQAMFETAEARRDAELFREQARRDPLTGVHNRRYVDEHLPELIAHAVAAGEPLTIAMVDLDHFKRINDTLSHDVGDRVLVTVADLLRGLSGEGFAARLGGEEFLLVLPGVGLDEAEGHLERVRATVGSYAWRPITGSLPVTVSIGAAGTGPAGPADQSALLAAADRNLYAAKHGGRNRVVTRAALSRQS